MKAKTEVIIEEFFYVLSAAIVVFCCLEMFQTRIILNYFNLNILLIIWPLNAIILLLIKNKNRKYE